MYLDMALIAVCTLIFSCIATRIERSWLSGPLLFVLAGFALGPYGFNILNLSTNGETLKVLAEITLAIVLFNDAASIGIRPLSQHPQIPSRTLLLGLPLTLLLGALIGRILFPSLSWIEVGLLSIILAPTDAALGLAVIKNTRVPTVIRTALNAESGLNDGICVPFLLVFLVLASDLQLNQHWSALVAVTLVRELGLGACVGLTTTTLGWLLCSYAIKQNWLNQRWMMVPTLSLAIIAFGLAQTIGGSGFIAAFCGGLLFGDKLNGTYTNEMETMAIDGEIFSLVTWLLFGVTAASIFNQLQWQHWLYALSSLTFIRMLPVFMSLLGTSLNWQSKLFIGWFGPRGLASIVFMIMVLHSDIPHSQDIACVVTLTVLLSILLHGITATPWANRLQKKTL